nr:hypothetical protein [uncultured Rhodoferax sp.]
MGKSPEQLAQQAAYKAITARLISDAIDAKANPEKKRRAELLAIQAKRWEQSELIRSYVAAVMAAAPINATDGERHRLKAWEVEALEAASHADPIPALVASLIGRAT